jgi:hypothetical protein
MGAEPRIEVRDAVANPRTAVDLERFEVAALHRTPKRDDIDPRTTIFALTTGPTPIWSRISVDSCA